MRLIGQVKTFATVVQGMDLLGHTEIWTKLFSLTSPRPGGIDIALWDIKGKAAGLPVFRILGGTGTEVFTYATGGYYLEGEPLDSATKELAGFVSNGYKAVKLKCGALSLKDEVARIKMVREAIGPDVLFMLDMNAPYDVQGCIAFANAVAPHDVFWLEEPLHWYLQPADFRRLADASPIPLAHGDHTRHPLHHAIYRGGAEVKDGMVHLTEAPGFGLEIDWSAVGKCRAP